MKTNPTLAALKTQTAQGRKVSLLLAYVQEHGPQPSSILNHLVKQSKALRLAVSMDYLILTPDGKHSMGQGGHEVIAWLLGKVTRPESWDRLEARCKVTHLTRGANGH